MYPGTDWEAQLPLWRGKRTGPLSPVDLTSADIRCRQFYEEGR